MNVYAVRRTSGIRISAVFVAVVIIVITIMMTHGCHVLYRKSILPTNHVSPANGGYIVGHTLETEYYAG